MHIFVRGHQPIQNPLNIIQNSTFSNLNTLQTYNTFIHRFLSGIVLSFLFFTFMFFIFWLALYFPIVYLGELFWHSPFLSLNPFRTPLPYFISSSSILIFFFPICPFFLSNIRKYSTWKTGNCNEREHHSLIFSIL